jgi:leucyl-tRNA synthetase
MTDKNKSRTESELSEIVREVANNVKEIVEDMKENGRALAQELGLAEPDSPRDQSRSQEPTRPDENRYNPEPIELKWSKLWESDAALYAADPASDKKKYYVVEMLPYPSGALHMGHVRNYSIGDALARYMWMNGYNVLHPMGWDSFGLPAENAAIKNQRPPREWTLGNIANMKRQMKRLGFAYDWSKEVTTCLPEYYRWNQWFFLKLYEKGLAYRKKSKVNWCPECATVLANEQAKNGFCWRHETTRVEQRELEQWFLRITNYAEELLRDIDQLPDWPDNVRKQQRDWIGRSKGALVDFKLDGLDGTISVFTTRIDTIYGATSVQLAPEHPVVADIIANDPELHAKVEGLIAEQRRAKEAGDIGNIEKHGIDARRFVTNPFNGEKIPVWIANYILMDYGTGAIMSVPAHDDRDYEFAKKYGLDIRVVILPRREHEPPESGQADEPVLPFTAEDSLLINSGPWSELSCTEAQKRMAEYAQQHGFGKPTVTYRLKDWGISRQRYWGTPIPMIYCPNDGIVPVPERDLPVLLPENVDITLAGGSPLSRVPEFVNVKCPKCGGDAHRETDTMDTFVDSSWYFYRYTSPTPDRPFDSNIVNYWFPIDQYIGGAEHAVLHLIYSRFWTKFMRDIRLVQTSEPAQRLFTQGMITKDGAKMSKSLGNLVSPDDMVARYGADAARMYTLFAAPPDQGFDWQDKGIEGVARFLSRVWRYVTRNARPNDPEWKQPVPEGFSPAARALQRKMHQTIKRITDDFAGRWHFNTSIAAIMEFVNELYAADSGSSPSSNVGALAGSGVGVSPTVVGASRSNNPSDSSSPAISTAFLAELQRNLVLMLAPFAPYLAHELWTMLGEDASTLLHHPWPKYDPALIKEDSIEIVVQINGKIRARVVVPADATEDQIKGLALADEKVKAALEGKQIVKVIVVRGKLVNIVVR